MTEQKSKRLFAFEFVLIVLPYAVVGSAITFSLFCAAVFAESLWEALDTLTMMVICGVPLWCGLHLSNTYRHGGKLGLAGTHGAWWWGMACVAIFPIVGIGAWLLVKLSGDFPISPSSNSEVENAHQLMASYLTALILFVPLLFPLAHLFVERQKALRSNKSLCTEVPKDGGPVS